MSYLIGLLAIGAAMWVISWMDRIERHLRTIAEHAAKDRP